MAGSQVSASDPGLAGAGLAINPIVAGEQAQWDAFVLAHPQATFFHRAAWRTVIEQGLGHRTHYLLARAAGRVVGVLPLAEIRSRLFGHRLVSTAGCVYGGALAADSVARQALVRAACGLAERLGVASLELRNLEPTESGWPTNDLYVTFRKEVSPEREANLKAIPRKQRAMVRKGIDAGLASVLTDDVARFWRIYAESVRNLGTPVFPLRYFRLLRQAFAAQTEIAIIRHGDRDIAAVMSFYFRDEVLPYYGGSLPVARELKGNDFMYWDLLCRAVGRGARVFDYGRSKVGSGSYHFKKNWGFEPRPLAYQYHLVGAGQPPAVNPNNPKYRLLIAAWQRLPLPVANVLGPWLSPALA